MPMRSAWQSNSPSGSCPPTGHSQREAKAHLYLLLVPQESSLPGSLSEYPGGRYPHLNSGVGSGCCPGLGSAVPTLQMGMLGLSEWIIPSGTSRGISLWLSHLVLVVPCLHYVSRGNGWFLLWLVFPTVFWRPFTKTTWKVNVAVPGIRWKSCLRIWGSFKRAKDS